MLTIYFGIDLDNPIYPQPQTELNTLYCGVNGLLVFLEQRCGILPTTDSITHLRIEQYRQALARYLTQDSTAFYAASFAADAFGTAEILLERRDEIMPFVDKIKAFETLNEASSRLQTFFLIEEFIADDAFLSLHKGFNDRLKDVMDSLPNVDINLKKVVFNEPFALLPVSIQRLFRLILNDEMTVIYPIHNAGQAVETTNLGIFQRHISRENTTKTTVKTDNSLLIIEADRETDAADFLANIIKNNANFTPLLLIPARNRALDSVFSQEGIPTLGIESASLARPTLQLLKLAATFLWQPIDPFKIMEFLTLPVKPLRDDLAIQLAVLMADAPGINSDTWYAKVETYFEELEAKLENEHSVSGKSVHARFTAARKQYDFWFNRARFNTNRRVPKQDVLDIYTELRRWSLDAFRENGSSQPSLLVLAEQAKRIIELLNELPEQERTLSFLEVEQLIRTVYASSPILLDETQVTSLPFVYHESAILSPTKNVVWWNFCINQNDHYFTNWYKPEIAFLETLHLTIDAPQKKATLRQWQRSRPVLNCTEQLILIVPHKIDGTETLEHPFLSELKATFTDYKKLVYRLDDASNLTEFIFKISQKEAIQVEKMKAAPPILHIKSTHRFSNFEADEKLYYSAINNLLNFPHSYVLQQKLKLRSSTILSVVADRKLKGNLAHRMFEATLKNEATFTDLDTLTAWFRQRIFTVMQQEGAVLMMYGREPERQQFEDVLLRAIWSFLTLIRDNKWQVLSVEKELNGSFCGYLAAGRTDVLLKNDKNEYCIVDLKWSGATYRSGLIRNGKDLQLVLYSKLLMQELGQPDDWAFSAYFIIEKGLFIARNNKAFAEAVVPTNIETDHRLANNETYQRMEATFKWRLKQLAEGKIEVRTTQNISKLDDIYYEEDLFPYLELPSESNPFDDFVTLVTGYE